MKYFFYIFFLVGLGNSLVAQNYYYTLDRTPIPSTNGGATYYVSSTGNDGNSGTSEETAWKTLAKVNSFIPIPGDQILFKRGDIWTGTINVNASGTAGRPIILGAYGIGAKPILSAAVNTPAITATAANRGYWTIDGLDIRSTGHPNGINQTLGIYFNYWPNEMGAVPGWVIKNCTFNCGILVSGPNTLISNNTFDGSGNSNNTYGAIGIRGPNGADVIIEGNTISNYTDRGIWVYLGADRPIIRNNIIHDIAVGGDQNGAGINVDGYAVTNFDSRIYGNTIYNCGYAISHENTFGGITYNNLIYDSGTGMTVYTYSDDYGSPLNLSIHNNIIYNVDRGIELFHSRNVLFANNIFHKDDYAGTEKTAFTIYESNVNVSELDFVNNIISGVWTGYPFKIYFNDKTIWTSFDYNIIVPTGTTIYREAGINRTLAYMQSEDFMLNGLISNPLFTKAGSDFTLQSGSPAINAGVGVGLTSDYRGFALVGTPDIGAYEYASIADNIAPIVSAFSIPRTSTSQTVSITSLTSTDNIGVTGYLLTETSSTPSSNAKGWSGTKPITYFFSTIGLKMLYAWVKDAAGNVSLSRNANVTVSSE